MPYVYLILAVCDNIPKYLTFTHTALHFKIMTIDLGIL